MGIIEKYTRWQYATTPIYFNKKIWAWLGKHYFSKSIKRLFKAVITLIICLNPAFYCMLKAIGMKRSFMTFTYMGITGAIFYMAPVFYCKWIALENKLNRLFWLSSQKPFWVNLIWAKYWDKKMAQIIKF